MCVCVCKHGKPERVGRCNIILAVGDWWMFARIFSRPIVAAFVIFGGALELGDGQTFFATPQIWSAAVAVVSDGLLSIVFVDGVI